MNDIFNMHKGEMALVNNDGIYLTSDSKDMFLFSDKKIKFSLDFEMEIDLTKITRFGGFQIRYFYDYENKVFFSIYFIHTDYGYEIRCINNNNPNFTWSFSEIYSIVPNEDIYFNGHNLFYFGDRHTRINLVSEKGKITVYINSIGFCEIDINKELKKCNNKIFENLEGKFVNVGFDACISQNILRNFEYKNENDSFSFLRKNVEKPYIIRFRPELVIDFQIGLSELEELCSSNIFNTIVVPKNNLDFIDIKNLSEKYNVLICTHSNKEFFYGMSMAHDMFTFVFTKKISASKIINFFFKFALEKSNLLFLSKKEKISCGEGIFIFEKEILRKEILGHNLISKKIPIINQNKSINEKYYKNKANRL